MPDVSPLVSIALCTYNGERFLEEQLQSLLSQTYSNIEIIAVDDCSIDNTLEILNNFSVKNPALKVYRNVTNVGYSKNFEKAISLCSGKYISLCDQDDIWDQEKIDFLISEFGDDDTLIYHDSEYIDAEGRTLNRYLSQTSGYIDGSEKYYVLYNNCVAGHATFFRSNLKSYLTNIPAAIPHDHWLAYVALAIGKIRFINKPLVQYRQHTNSITDILNSKVIDSPKIAETKAMKWHQHNSDRIKAIKAMRNFPFNTAEDLLFYDQLIDGLSELYTRFFSLNLFFCLLVNRKTLFHFYKKNAVSKFFRIMNNSFGKPKQNLVFNLKSRFGSLFVVG